MRTEQKVFNDLIETIVRNSENNIATITDVKLWAETWQKEMELELTLSGVVGQSEQLADHKCKPMVNADWTYLRCECGKRFEPKG